MNLIRLAAAVSAAFLLAACGHHEQTAAATPTAAAAPAAAANASPATLKLFQQTCHNCHAVPGTGAPQAGDAQAWAPRLAQGRDTLLDHTINGYKGMPPMGTCTQCAEQDFVALIEYMSGAQLK